MMEANVQNSMHCVAEPGRQLEASRRTSGKLKMPPRERIRMKRRCKLCGRARAVYRKFGNCRICFRD
jgi:ribosomal protein S14